MIMSALLLLMANGLSAMPPPSQSAELPVIAGEYFLLGRAPLRWPRDAGCRQPLVAADAPKAARR